MYRIGTPIYFITASEQAEIENHKCTTVKNRFGYDFEFVKTELRSERGAQLLNYVINRKLGNTYGVSGGLFGKCQARIVVIPNGEMWVIFKNRYRLSSYLRTSTGHNEIMSKVSDKLANELKKVWKEDTYDDITKTVEITTTDKNNINTVEMQFTYAEYRTVYEYLKGRDTKKIKEKYGANTYDRMIGKKIEDQFLISAIETIQATIKSVMDEGQAKIAEVEKKYRDLRNSLYTEESDNKNRIENETKAQIAELQNQLDEMLKMGNASPAAV